MAKLVVKIDMHRYTKLGLLEALEREPHIWFPTEPDKIAVDEGELECDPTDDSYYLFEYVGVED